MLFSENVWVQVITAVASLLSGGIFTHFFMNKKYKAEAAATISAEAIKLVQSLQKELETVKQEINTLRADNIIMHKTIAILETDKIHLQDRVNHLEAELAKYSK